MNRTKMIYFLSAFVLIIGCFALNKSYSLFTQTIESTDPISSTVPVKDAALSIESIILGPGEEYLIKQTVTNKSIVPINFWINTDQIENVKIANHTSLENNKTYGISSESTSLAKESTKDIYLIVSNSEGTTNLTINFTLDYNYTTITPSAEIASNISSEQSITTQAGLPYSDKPDTLTYKILENFANSDLYTSSETSSIETDVEIDIIDLLKNKEKIVYPVPVQTPLNVPSPTEFTGVETAEVGLYSSEDDYGTSYYFRGASSSNYVNFAGFTWRIVRINGDGSVRLILDGTLDKVSACDDTSICSLTAFNSSYDDNAYVGYMYGFTGINSYVCIKTAEDGTKSIGTEIDSNTCQSEEGVWTSPYDATHMNLNDSTIKTQLDSFYQKYLNTYNDYISDTIFCGDKTIGSDGTGIGTTTTYYGAHDRLYESSTKSTPTLKCAEDVDNTYSRYTVKGETTNKGIETNGDLTYAIALLSADELVMSGAFKDTGNQSYYLYDAPSNSLLYHCWWTMSPRGFIVSYTHEFSSYVSNNYSLSIDHAQNNINASRPVINLRSDLLWAGGNGTSGSGAYTVSLPEE